MTESGLLDIFDFLLINDSKSLLDLFDGEPDVDDQVFGHVTGKDEFIEFLDQKYKWLNKQEARSVVYKVTENDFRVALEYILYLDQGKFDLPIAIIADKSGNRYSQIRIYHSTWPYTGSHSVRKPLLQVNNNLEEPNAVQEYMEALSTGDFEKVLKLYNPRGYFREPSGSKYKYEGIERLTELYTNFLSKGGIKLDHTTATFDGKTAVIEFIAKEWAGVKMEPQAGVAFYDIDEDGKIMGARVYDDVDPPI